MKSILTFLLACVCSQLAAQHVHSENEKHAHGHAHHKNEIGIANSPVYLIKAQEFSYGLHAHYIRAIGESKFGLGLGYERIFDEHGHNTIGLVVAYRPFEKLSFSVSPGITVEDEDLTKPAFATHLETVYEFELGDFHLGPLLEFAYDPEDYHVSLGLHVGFGF